MRAPLTHGGSADERIEIGGGLPDGGADDLLRAMDPAFGHMQGVAHDALSAVAEAVGLTKEELAPLLDFSPLPDGASNDDKGSPRPTAIC